MTSKTKFTPGPWRVVTDHPTNAAVHIYAECEGWHSDDLATLYGPYEGEEDENGVWPLGETRMANANLIAAAPDLYAALDDLWTWVENWQPEFMDDPEFERSMYENALAKARGETK